MTQFTIEELDKLAQICDIATKAGGIQVAQVTLPLVAKIQQIVKEMQKENKQLPENLQ